MKGVGGLAAQGQGNEDMLARWVVVLAGEGGSAEMIEFCGTLPEEHTCYARERGREGDRQ